MALLEKFWKPVRGNREVGVPYVGVLNGYLPWLVTFLTEIGLRVKILRSDGKSLARGEERCFSSIPAHRLKSLTRVGCQTSTPLYSPNF
jgi:predicted nucleotide-binding protein (sugar kinase/HSP70/actin superfamily)